MQDNLDEPFIGHDPDKEEMAMNIEIELLDEMFQWATAIAPAGVDGSIYWDDVSTGVLKNVPGYIQWEEIEKLTEVRKDIDLKAELQAFKSLIKEI